MCLNLKSSKTRAKTAKKDIICYKMLERSKTFKVSTGDSFIAEIKNQGIIDGNIYVGESNYIYLCHNNSELDGADSPDKLGFAYSWAVSKYHWLKDDYRFNCSSLKINDKDIIINGIFVGDEIEALITPYYTFNVEVGNTYTSELKKTSSSVEEGLHTFADLSDLCDENADNNGRVIVKCIIPKGSKYYEGVFGFKDSFASDKLTYLEIIKVIKKQLKNNMLCVYESYASDKLTYVKLASRLHNM